MQQSTTGVFTLPCSQASNVSAYLRMKTDATYGLALAGSTDEEIGVLNNTFVASGLGSSKVAGLVLAAFPGPIKMVASGAITKFAAVYADANGKISASGTLFRGYALDAATADGDVIRVVRNWPSTGSAVLSALSTLIFTAATGSNVIQVTTNLADALTIKDTAGSPVSFMTLVTTTATPKIQLKQNTTVAAGKYLTLGSATLAAALTGAPAQIANQVSLVTCADSSNVFVKLPNPAGLNAGQSVEVVNTSTQTVTVKPYASETIAGGSSATIVTLKTSRFITDGTNWFSHAGA